MKKGVRSTFHLALLLFVVALLAACGSQATPPADTAAPAPAEQTDTQDAPATDAATGGDLLAEVQSRGVLRVSTDSNYAPQSFLNPDGEWEGFDIEVAREIARRLGVEAEFLDINFDVITAGSWNDRWDVNIGSMTITPARAEVLLFTEPYYYTPASFGVHADSAAAAVSDLDGLRVGVGAATTYVDYLNNELTLEGEEIVIPAPAAEAQIYDTDLLAIQDLSLGDGTRLDAVLTALPTLENAIQNGQPLRVLDDPVYYEALAVALDRSSSLDSTSLADEISRIITEMREDGTLTRLSEQFYGVDIATKAE